MIDGLDLTALKRLKGEYYSAASLRDPPAGPTAAPTAGPTDAPTASPTAAPTASPTAAPTAPRTPPCACGSSTARPQGAEPEPEHPLCAAFSPLELQVVLAGLRKGKAPGIDTISAEMLQHLGPRAQAHLLRLANRSWAHAEVPQPWRTAWTSWMEHVLVWRSRALRPCSSMLSCAVSPALLRYSA